MFFTRTDLAVKEKIIQKFTRSSNLRIVISTIAFGMGIDCPDAHMIVHLGEPDCVDTYVQQVGRAVEMDSDHMLKSLL